MKIHEMTEEQLNTAIAWGKAVIDDYKEEKEAVPSFVYERQLELLTELVSRK